MRKGFLTESLIIEQAPFQDITLSTKGWGGWGWHDRDGRREKVRQERGETWGQCRGGGGNWVEGDLMGHLESAAELAVPR